MPITPRNYQPIPYSGGARYVPPYSTLGEFLGLKVRNSAEGWSRVAGAFDRFVQTKHAEKAAEAQEQLRRDEMAARAAEREEAGQIRREATERQRRMDAEKYGSDVAESIGYGPMSEAQVDPVMRSPQAGRVRYSFGPGTADGPELMPTRDQQTAIDARKAIEDLGGAIGPGGQVVMPPKPTATKSLQRDTQIVNGRPTIVNFDPETGQYFDLRGNKVEPQPLPRESGGQRQITPNMEAALIRQWNTQWMTATKPERELKRQITMMDSGLEAARRGDLAQGNEAVLQTFLKVLDPASVVREGEFWRLQQGQSLINRARAAVQRITDGGWVPMEELERYSQLAHEIQEGLAKQSLPERRRIERNAARRNIPTELIFADDVELGGLEDAGAMPGGGRGAAGAGADPLSVTTPDGQVFRFPTPEAAAQFRRQIGGGQ
jgi:hypothetical protein